MNDLLIHPKFPGHNDGYTGKLSSPRTSKQRMRQASPAVRDIITQENKDIEFGQKITPGMKLSKLDRMRLFHYNDPKLSVAAGVVSLVALSTALGVATGWAVDELAHLTDRKNDKVGLVIGLFVGIASAFTQAAQMFGAARRGEMRLNARIFSPDATTMEGSAYNLISRRSPVMLAALVRNAKSLKGYQHNEIEFKNTHVRDAINYCIRQRYGKEIWKHSMEEYDELPPGKNAYWQATADCEPLGFHKGKYYVARHKGTNDFLEAEMQGCFDQNEGRHNKFFDVVAGLKKANTDGDVTIRGKMNELGRFAESIGNNRMKKDGDFEAEWNRKYPNDPVEKSLRDIEKGLYKARDYTEFKELVKNGDALARSANSSLLRLFDVALGDVQDSVTKSFVRIDELCKVKIGLNGLRAPSLHTWATNLRDSVASVFSSLTDGSNQGAVAGNQLTLFIPLTLCSSMISILLLGMSSSTPSCPAGKNGQNGSDHMATLGVFPAYESGAGKLNGAQSQQQASSSQTSSVVA